jgi:hypothetical protein
MATTELLLCCLENTQVRRMLLLWRGAGPALLCRPRPCCPPLRLSAAHEGV